MIYLVIKRTALELWDNGFAAFAINLAVLGLLLAVSLLQEYLAATSVGSILGLAVSSAVLLLVLPAAGGSFEQFVSGDNQKHNNTHFPYLRLVLAAVLGAPILMWSVYLLSLVNWSAPEHAGDYFAVILFVWVTITASGIALSALIGLAESGLSTPQVIRRSLIMVLGYPIQTTVLISLGALLAILSLGLFPGLVGLAQLVKNAGRIMESASLDSRTLQAVLADERQSLSRRNVTSVVFPWRVT